MGNAVSMFPTGSLSDLGLISACETTLYQSVNCNSAISALMTSGYVGSFNNATTTTAVCSADCGTSIGQLRHNISVSCGQTIGLIPGLPFLGLIDILWSNWNQSCFYDPSTGENCNDVIAAFPDVADLSSLPILDLCSFCNLKKLALMQADAYTSAYDSNWQSTYEYVASTCNISVANYNATTSAFNLTMPSSTPNCVSGKTYTTVQGDTCDSIALAHSISSATMFYINYNIHNCSAILPGTSLCLPLACNSLYNVQTNDSCTSIAVDTGIMTQDLLSYNSHLNWNCTNLHSTDPYWGSTLCVSTPGGPYIGQALNTSSSTGSEVVDPPAGATVAPGTTTDCGQWYLNDGSLSLTCAQICLAYSIPINLFTQANPSLGKTTCDTDLVLMDAYCIRPLTGWNWGNATTSAITSSSSATPTTKATTTTSSLVVSTTSPGNGITTPTPYQTGMVTNCDKFHLVVKGDECGTVASNAGIALDDFYSWNPAVGTSCQYLDLGDYVCISTLTCTLASVLAAPKQYASICGAYGFSHDSPTSLLIASYTSGPYVASAAACGAQCLATSTCTNLYFIEGKNCNLHKGTSTFLESAAAGYYSYYEASCFSSGEACGSYGVSHDTTSTLIISYTSGSLYVGSAAACGARCLSVSACTNIYFIQGSNCNLHFGASSYRFSAAAGYYSWYPTGCFVCNSFS